LGGHEKTMKALPDHWNSVYDKRASSDVSWFQAAATTSLDLIARARVPLDGAIVDVGAGASTLVDGLLACRYGDISLLDVAERAHAETRSSRSPAPTRGRTSAVRSHSISCWQPPRRLTQSLAGAEILSAVLA
jgi:hypothetical protein